MIIGIFTNGGLRESIHSQFDAGWKIFPRGFSVSSHIAGRPLAWQVSYDYDTLGTFIKTADDEYFEVTVIGTSDVTEPVWSGAPDIGDTIVDGGVTWTRRVENAYFNGARTMGTWEATKDYTTDDSIRPTTKNGKYFECTTAGTSGGTEPVAFTTASIGDTVGDGSVIWTCREMWYDRDYPNPADGLIASHVVIDDNTIEFNCTIPPAVAASEKEVGEVFLYGESLQKLTLTGTSADGATTIATGTFDAPAADFVTDGIVAGDILRIIGGVDEGDYPIETITDLNTLELFNTSFNASNTDLAFEIHSASGEFLLAYGQPDTTLVYDETGSVTMRLSFTLANVNIASTYVFQYTQAQEISAHDDDVNAHPKIQDAIEKLGIFVQGPTDPGFDYRGQPMFEVPEFDGAVTNKKVVYKNDGDDKFYLALADGTAKALSIGIADVPRNMVMTSGLISTGLTFSANGVDVYLSDSTDGAITESVTTVLLGRVVDKDAGVISLGTAGGGGGAGVVGGFTFEDDDYQLWADRSSFSRMYADTFVDSATVALAGDATFNATEGRYDGTSGGSAIITSPNMIPETPIGDDTELKTFYRFEGRFEGTAGLTTEYAIDETVRALDVDQDDGVTTVATKQFSDADALFETGAVKPVIGDTLYIQTGADAGYYIIASIDSETQLTVYALSNFSGDTGIAYSVLTYGSWTAFNSVEITTILAGFRAIKFRATWASDGYIDSFGIIYDQSDFSYNTDTIMREYYTVPANVSAPVVITLPNNAEYAEDGKSLEVFRNGLRRPTSDYTETDKNTITWTIDNLKAGDVIEFIQRYGYVDISADNTLRLNKEHEADGSHSNNIGIIFDSGDIDITGKVSGNIITEAHGLNTAPILFLAFLKCKTTDLNYTVGDIVQLGNAERDGALESKSTAIKVDGTNVYYRFSGSTYIRSWTGGDHAAIDRSKWDLILRAWGN